MPTGRALDAARGVLGPSHGYLELLARGPSDRVAELRLAEIRYEDLPARMHDIRLRLATPEEAAGLQRELPESQARNLEADECLPIECDEGKYYVWGGILAIRSLAEPDWAALEPLSGPLWSGGPSYSEM